MQNISNVCTIPKVALSAAQDLSGGAATVSSFQNTNNNSNIFDGIDANQTQWVSGDIGNGLRYAQLTLALTTPMAVGDYSAIELANVDVSASIRPNGTILLHLINEGGQRISSVPFSNQPGAVAQDIILFVGGYSEDVYEIQIEQYLQGQDHSALRVGEVKLRGNPVSVQSSQGVVFENQLLQGGTNPPTYKTSDGTEVDPSGLDFIDVDFGPSVIEPLDTTTSSSTTCSSGIYTTAASGLTLYAILGTCDQSTPNNLVNTSAGTWAFDTLYTSGTRSNYILALTGVGQNALSNVDYYYQVIDNRICDDLNVDELCVSIFSQISGSPSETDLRVATASLPIR